MSSYFSGSSNQSDAATMLYLKENLPTAYSESPVLPGNIMMFMNYSSSSGSYSDTPVGISRQQNSCIDIPSAGASDSNPSQEEILCNLGGQQIGQQDCNAWKDGRTAMLLMHPTASTADILQGPRNLQGQGLSLSLSTSIPSGIQMSSIQYTHPIPGFSSFLGPNTSVSGEGSERNVSFGENGNSQPKQPRTEECMPTGFLSNSDAMRADFFGQGMSSIRRDIPTSKYLKAAQELLDEVVNVRKSLKENNCRKEFRKDSQENEEGAKMGTSDSAIGASSASELSAAEKQDLQNKLTKLLSMLDEVDRRYKQYYHQMQIVVSSFDAVAGFGAAKPYTALALQTISRHFRCLRDAINGQIRVTRTTLGDQDGSSDSKGVGISRLRHVDQQLRQQRALQQLGMVQQHTWRPQRGLPESSVSILRAWLFEHFLHPYPKDSEKIMLARQTGLTRSQVSNWFINARVRLWKPMVEEMYKEEIGDIEMDSNSSSEILAKATKSDTKASEDRGEDFQQSATSSANPQCNTGQFFEMKSDHVPDVPMVGCNTDPVLQNMTSSKPESKSGMGRSREDQRPNIDSCSFFPDTIVQSSGGSERFMVAAATAYRMSELEKFGNGNGVSLTLGLQQRYGDDIPMSVAGHHNFVSMRGDNEYNVAATSMGLETPGFDCLDSGNQQHQFGPPHLLHDFVA